MSRWRLDSVEINGFRGVAGKRRFDFLGKNGLLFGPNGQGKSTVPLAIQWGLFGKFPTGILQNTKFSSFLGSWVKGEGAYSVRLAFQRDGRRLVVSRADGNKRKGFQVEVDGETYADAKAEEKRDELLSMDLDTFARLILLQQSRIRGLLMDEVSERRKAMDKLLGIDVLADIATELKPKRFLDRADALLSEGEKTLIGLEGEERKLVDLREKAQETARKQGFENRHFSLAGLKREFAELSAELAQIAESYGVPLVSVPTCAAVEDGRRVCGLVRAAIARVRTEADVRKRLAAMDSEFATLAALVDRWRENFRLKEGAEQALRDHEIAAGSQEELERKAKALSDRFEQAKKDLASANALSALLGDALRYLEASAVKDCPVCERPMPGGGADSIRERAGKLADETTQALERAKVEASEAADAHDNLKRVRRQLVEECDDRKRRLDKVRGEALTALGGSGTADERMAARLGDALASKKSARDQLARGASALSEALDKVGQRTDAVSEALLPVLSLSTDLAAVEDERKLAARGGGAESRKAQLLRALADRVKELKQLLLDAKEEHATAALNVAASRAQDLYSMLVDHPYFDTFTIEPVEQIGNVNYCYRVFKGAAAGDGAEARLVLSDGQMTAAALALFYALAESAHHSFDLLFIDDPTQNLDDKRKESMARAITQIAKLKQVVISTHDADFEAKLEDAGFKDGAACFRFRDWNGDPQVSAS